MDIPGGKHLVIISSKTLAVSALVEEDMAAAVQPRHSPALRG